MGSHVPSSGVVGQQPQKLDMQIRDEGVQLPQRSYLDFVGTGVSAADIAGITRVTIPGGSLPPGWYNVLDHGLVDDITTNNSPACQSLVDSIPEAVAYGAYAVFYWPFTNKGIYGFSSQVNWGERAIKNIGLGSPASVDIQRIVSAAALNNSMSIFKAARGSGGGHAGPSFENFGFFGNGKTSVVGLDLYQMNGGVLRDVMFRDFGSSGIGIRLNADGVDCAYQNYYNLGFHGCAKGMHSVDSNSWSLFGFLSEECPIGFDLRCNQVSIHGGKYNTPAAGNAFGMIIDGYATSIHGTKFEVETAGGDGNVLVKISDAGLDNGQNGCWNALDEISIFGGGLTTSKGVQLTTGANFNHVRTHYQSGFSDFDHAIEDNGKRNTINGGTMRGVAADRPAAVMHIRGQFYHATDTNVLTHCDGATWRTVGTLT